MRVVLEYVGVDHVEPQAKQLAIVFGVGRMANAQLYYGQYAL